MYYFTNPETFTNMNKLWSQAMTVYSNLYHPLTNKIDLFFCSRSATFSACFSQWRRGTMARGQGTSNKPPNLSNLTPSQFVTPPRTSRVVMIDTVRSTRAPQVSGCGCGRCLWGVNLLLLSFVLRYWWFWCQDDKLICGDELEICYGKHFL